MKQTTDAIPDDPHLVLRDQFALPAFRDGQLEVIERLLNGKNVAAVFPTGGGKSLCYQLPSQMLPHATVVVSPLIALMKDQCDALAARGIRAARLDSSLTQSEYREAIQGVKNGSIKLLYVSPERFFNERFLTMVDSLKISLFAIDEAHCISQWGHNFRPDYLKLADVVNDFSAERVLALTATATPEVLSDIRDAFAIEADDAVRTTFHRPNLRLSSTIVESPNHYETLLHRIHHRDPGSTLVYVTLQRTAEELAERLDEDGRRAVAYHAGLQTELRASIQHEFIHAKDLIVVATIAFGMGIDKADLRYVYHFNPPKSLESYAQEIGRAGRDGKPATCEMLLRPEDRTLLENFTYGDTPSRRGIRRLVDRLLGQADSFHVSHYKLSSECDIRVLVVKTLITYLELDGYLKATSPRYDSYKIKPLVSSKFILDRYEGETREFAAAVLSHLVKSRTWFLLNTVVAASKIGCERKRIVRAIEHMSQQGWLEIKVSDLVHGYRWLRRPTPSRHESGEKTDSELVTNTLADDLHHRLLRRERQEVARLNGVFEIAKAERCQAEILSNHFGENLPKPCGQCSACQGDGPFRIPEIQSRKIGTSATQAIDRMTREHPDHFVTARDRARFLCGLSSPAFVRSKLSRDPHFGVCSEVPFADVLAQVGGQIE